MSDAELTSMEGCEGALVDGCEKPCELQKLFSVVALRCNGVDNSEDLLHGAKRYQPEGAITRDFMTPDGKCTPMKPGEYSPEHVGKEA